MRCGDDVGSDEAEAWAGLAEARRGLEIAAAEGDAGSQAILGNLVLHGRGGPQDYAEARRLFGLAGAQGHAEAQEMSEMMGSTWWAGMHPA